MKITIFGDLMLDLYYHGEVVKRNPEANGEVIRVSQTARTLGGAAAVGMLCQCLGAEVTICGALGGDAFGTTLRTLLERQFAWRVHVTHRTLEVTTTKIRTFVDGRLRPDRIDVEQLTSEKVCDAFYEAPLGDLVIVQDYGKGVITEASMKVLRRRVADAGVPLIVDPALDADWRMYLGASLIKANLLEAQRAAKSREDAVYCCMQLAHDHDTAVVVTAGERGIHWHDGLMQGGFIPAVRPSLICDVCGCGDTVLATMAVAWARGLSLERACVLAAKTAAQQVAQWGVGPIHCEELLHAPAPSLPRTG